MQTVNESKKRASGAKSIDWKEVAESVDILIDVHIQAKKVEPSEPLLFAEDYPYGLAPGMTDLEQHFFSVIKPIAATCGEERA